MQRTASRSQRPATRPASPDGTLLRRRDPELVDGGEAEALGERGATRCWPRRRPTRARGRARARRGSSSAATSVPSPSWRAAGSVSTETSNQRALRHGAYANADGHAVDVAVHIVLRARAARAPRRARSARWSSGGVGGQRRRALEIGQRRGSGSVCRIARCDAAPGSPTRAAARRSRRGSRGARTRAQADDRAGRRDAMTIRRARSWPSANPPPSARRQLAGSRGDAVGLDPARLVGQRRAALTSVSLSGPREVPDRGLRVVERGTAL